MLAKDREEVRPQLYDKKNAEGTPIEPNHQWHNSYLKQAHVQKLKSTSFERSEKKVSVSLFILSKLTLRI